jgi:decaprenylphospho-beta-D-ribofuranose 2-oxidase
VLLTGWGRTSPSRAEVLEVSVDEVASAITSAGPRGLVARGLGRSYGDAAQNAGGRVLRMLGDVRDVRVDNAQGTAWVPAGVALRQLIPRLLRKGWFVPVSPGTCWVTAGGAIAADIHGKNHHRDGSFGAAVRWLDMVDGTGQRRRLEPTGTPEEFWATVGGMGLTGVVLGACIGLKAVRTAFMCVDTERADNLRETLDLLREADMRAPYSLAWVDLLARGPSLGRAVVSCADHALPDQLGGGARRDPLALPDGEGVQLPRWIPEGLLNRASMRAFNELWFRKAPRCRRGAIVGIGPFFHPLDQISDWNRLYGRRGFVQYQFLLPFGAEEALQELVQLVAHHGSGSFLGVLKRLGTANPSPLSFPAPGWALALDMPVHPGVRDLLERLDGLLLAAGGRIYLAKDARAGADTIAAMYPRLPEFQQVRRRLDPGGVFCSDLARRLDLMGKP